MRFFKVFVLLALVAVVGAGVIRADDATVPTFSDGRVNNWQIDAPVAVYCVFDHSEDVNVGVFQRIEVWGLSGDKLLDANSADIDAANGAAVLDSAGGDSLTQLADGSFQVSAPDGYVFTWARGDTTC